MGEREREKVYEASGSDRDDAEVIKMHARGDVEVNSCCTVIGFAEIICGFLRNFTNVGMSV